MNQGSEVAPLVAEAMLWKTRSTGMKTALALQNAGGVRTDIEQTASSRILHQSRQGAA